MGRAWGTWITAVLLGCAGCSAPSETSRTDLDTGKDGGTGTGLSNPDGGGGTGGMLTDGGVSDGGVSLPVDAGVTLVRGGGDWPQYRHDAQGTSSSPGLFTVNDAANLTELWHRDLGFYAVTEPIIVGDTVYATSAYSGTVWALDAATGATRWQRTLNYVFPNPCDSSGEAAQLGFWASPAVANGVLYVPSPDGNLYALDAATGTTLFTAPVANAAQSEISESSPTVSLALGKVYVGVASVFGCYPAQGRVVSVDLSSHAVATANMSPTAGGSVWSSLSLDEQSQTLWATTGDAAKQPLTSDVLAQSFVALDPTTLAVNGHWQNPEPADSDLDFGASPTLFVASDGTRLVGAGSKDGTFFVMDRDHLDAGPLWTTQVAQGGDPSMSQGTIVSPTFANGMLYVSGGVLPPATTASVVAHDPKTGSVVWSTPVPGYVIAPMAAMGDVLAVEVTPTNNGTGQLVFLDAKTGELVKSYAGSSASFAGPTIGNGKVLWFEYGGTLHAYSMP